MAVWPRCPNCGAKARDGAKFTIEPDLNEEGKTFKKGDIIRAATHLCCQTCNSVFPLWTYTKGDPSSYSPNAVDDNGRDWTGARENDWRPIGG